MIKTVSYVHTPDRIELLATFELVEDEVRATYESVSYRRQVDDGEVWDAGRELTPADGRVFFDALDRVYASSSRIVVERVED